MASGAAASRTAARVAELAGVVTAIGQGYFAQDGQAAEIEVVGDFFGWNFSALAECFYVQQKTFHVLEPSLVHPRQALQLNSLVQGVQQREPGPVGLVDQVGREDENLVLGPGD